MVKDLLYRRKIVQEVTVVCPVGDATHLTLCTMIEGPLCRVYLDLAAMTFLNVREGNGGVTTLT